MPRAGIQRLPQKDVGVGNKYNGDKCNGDSTLLDKRACKNNKVGRCGQRKHRSA